MSFLLSARDLSAIPDSVINHWPVDEGSGTTVYDDIGSNNVTLNTDLFASDSTYVGGYKLDFDGTDDEGTSAAESPSGSLTMAVTLYLTNDITNIQTVFAFGNANDAVRRLWFRGDQTTNELQTSVKDSDGNRVDPGYVVSTGSPLRIAGIVDAPNDQVRLAVNGTVQATADASSITLSNSLGNHAFGRSPAADQRFYAEQMDNAMLADEAWSDQTVQDDYEHQPWS